MTGRTLRAHAFTAAAALSAVLLIVNCAHMEPPSGGPVDTKPPAVVAVYPAPGARNVPLDAPVVIQFSEWIDRTTARNQAFVSPPTRGRLRVVAEGNKLQVEPSEASGGWRANTSYQVTVLPTLVDLHAVRAGRPFTLRFSTGATTDSASLSGTALSAGAATAAVKRVVALYRVGDRQNVEPLSARATDFKPASQPEPWRELPAFIALADTMGAFRFDSVAQGDYALFAFEDVNGNFAYDFGFENAATGPLSLSLRPHAVDQVLRTSPMDTIPLRISKATFIADAVADLAADSARPGSGVSAPGLLTGGVQIDFSRTPHPVRAAEPSRYRILSDSGPAIPVLSAGWNPLAEAWVLETAPLKTAREYRVEMREPPDFKGRQVGTGSGLADTSLPFTVGAERDTTDWKLAFIENPLYTSLPRPLTAAATARDFSVASSRSLSPARWDLLSRRLQVRVDSATAPATLSRINNFTFSLKLSKIPAGGKRVELKLRPEPGDSVSSSLGALDLLDTSLVGSIRFTPPARWTGWTFRMDGADASYRIPGSSGLLESPTIPLGRYRLFAFRDEDRDGEWNPGSVKPWIPQEPQALVVDSVMVKSGPAADISGLFERPRK